MNIQSVDKEQGERKNILIREEHVETHKDERQGEYARNSKLSLVNCNIGDLQGTMGQSER